MKLRIMQPGHGNPEKPGKTNEYGLLVPKHQSECHHFLSGALRLCLALIGILWLGVTVILADTHYVRAPGTCTNTVDQAPFTNWDIAATNIQWAVTNATDAADTVLVSNGVYTTIQPFIYNYRHPGGTWSSNISIVCMTSAITLHSVNGPTVTVIDGNYPAIKARVVFVSGNAVLDGFTVRNGYAQENTEPKNTFADGGGVYIMAVPYGTENGGIVTNCIVYNNYANERGGGICLERCTGVIANCTIYSNTSYYDGGGGVNFCVSKNPCVMQNCVVWGNRAQNNYPGGGLYVGPASKHALIRNCLFYGNTATNGSGGGIAVNSSVNSNSPLENCIENCVIVDNIASNSGGGLSIGSTNMSIRNVIVYNNRVIDSANTSNSDVYVTGAGFLLSNSCIGVTNWAAALTAGSGNITNDPQFVNTNIFNYRLANNSPCINAGMNRSWMTNGVDLDGRARIRYGTVDMGAYEKINEATIYNFR